MSNVLGRFAAAAALAVAALAEPAAAQEPIKLGAI